MPEQTYISLTRLRAIEDEVVLELAWRRSCCEPRRDAREHVGTDDGGIQGVNGDASNPRDDMKSKGISHRICNRYRMSQRQQEGVMRLQPRHLK